MAAVAGGGVASGGVAGGGARAAGAAAAHPTIKASQDIDHDIFVLARITALQQRWLAVLSAAANTQRALRQTEVSGNQLQQLNSSCTQQQRTNRPMKPAVAVQSLAMEMQHLTDTANTSRETQTLIAAVQECTPSIQHVDALLSQYLSSQAHQQSTSLQEALSTIEKMQAQLQSVTQECQALKKAQSEPGQTDQKVRQLTEQVKAKDKQISQLQTRLQNNNNTHEREKKALKDKAENEADRTQRAHKAAMDNQKQQVAQDMARLNHSLEAKLQTAQAELQIAQAETQRLRKENQDLTQENKELVKEENDKETYLQSTLQEYQFEISHLKHTNTDLNQEIQRLAAQVAQLEAQGKRW